MQNGRSISDKCTSQNSTVLSILWIYFFAAKVSRHVFPLCGPPLNINIFIRSHLPPQIPIHTPPYHSSATFAIKKKPTTLVMSFACSGCISRSSPLPANVLNLLLYPYYSIFSSAFIILASAHLPISIALTTLSDNYLCIRKYLHGSLNGCN